MQALVLIHTSSSSEGKVVEAIQQIDDEVTIEKTFIVFGEYDVVVILRGKDPQTIGRMVTKKIRKLPGVTKTTTLMSISEI